MLHANCQKFHGGAKYSMQTLKCSLDNLNIPHRGFRRGVVHGDLDLFHGTLKCST